MNYAIPLWEQPSLPIAGRTERFPVRRIYCVGRNYAEHAREMGHDPDRELPFFFMKPADAIVQNDAAIPYPVRTKDVHHEIELVVALKSGGADIALEKALDHVFGYAVGIDLTRRDLQGEAKKAGRPWDMGKGFDNSAPCSAIVPASKIGHPSKGAIWLKVNGAIRQSADLSALIWSVPEMISYLSGLVALKGGDLLYSGTPAGVGPTVKGDTLEGHVDSVGELTIRIV
ncbi:MAG TPA: fumarylacetoacetate hydrolase family protein [Alphaproteobacteria bacterium]|nr:fumarylacetoacetate hydrolase family protein [Alphaproteobacteria bacterium]